MKHIALGLCCFLAINPFCFSIAEGSFPGVKVLMTPGEFSGAGLDKLDNEERQRLDAWLADHLAERLAEAQIAQRRLEERIAEEREKAARAEEREKASRVAAEAQEKERDGGTISAKVVPTFTGWTGKTVFELDNGQVWRQRFSGRFGYNGDSSEVEIHKGVMGLYSLHHPESGRSVGVTRVR